MSRRHPTVEALAAAVRRATWLARAVVLWERLWPALLPALAVAGIFVAASLFAVWALVPGWLHAAALVLFGGAFVVLLWRGIRGVRVPGRDEAIRRIERASRLDHRPLAALGDRPAAGTGDRTAQALWRAHLERMARLARDLRVGLASPGLARLDPMGLRAALLLILVIAVVLAGEDRGARLARAFQPDFTGLGASGPPELTVWITPPAYTGLAPVFLAADRPAEVTVPVGSEVLARVHGGRGVPRLDIDGESTPFATVDSANYEIRAPLKSGRRLAIVQGAREIAAWPLSLVADQPPTIEFAKPPGRSHRLALRLDYLAEDDYAIVSVDATIRRADDPAQSFTLDLPLPRTGAREVEDTSFHDLTPHPWAGLEVTIALGVIDAVGQSGSSDPITIVLPERIFNHPVARALIEQRKALTLDPGNRTGVSHALHEISRQPRHFFEDLGIYLGLRMARWRLLYDRSDKAVGEIQALLWDLALTIEDGPLALAEQDLRDVEQALLDALNRAAGDEEIERLIDELLAALDNFLDALAEQALNDADIDPGFTDQMQQMVGRDELRDVIERIRELYRTGARDAARELLSRLQEALENLRAGRFAGMDPRGVSQGEAALRDLGRLIEQQQNLLDQTFRRAQEGGRPGEGGRPLGPGEQERLRRGLGELMMRWGESGMTIPRPLGRAELSMRGASRALRENRPGDAVGPQTEAVDQMQQGAQAMLESLLQQLGQVSRRPGENRGLFGGERDPLGRGFLGRGYQDDGRTRVPDEAALQRSREILEELYRRAGELDRPAGERAYIRRLLRRF